MKRTNISFIVLSITASLGCKGNPVRKHPAQSEAFIYELDLTETLPSLIDPESAEPQTAYELRETLQQSVHDKHFKGLFVRIGPQPGEWAVLEELQKTLLSIKTSGKPIHCHFADLDHAAYGFATSVCDQLAMTPAGQLQWVGLSIEQFFLKDFLNEIGVTADIEQVGQYKGTGDMLTQAGMSEPLRRSLSELIEGLEKILLNDVATSRKLNVEQLENYFTQGPYGAEQATALKLIDTVAFEDEARESFRQLTHAHAVTPLNFSDKDERTSVHWTDLFSALLADDAPKESKKPHVVVAHLVGSIVDGESEPGETVGSVTWVRKLSQWQKSPHVKGLVVRIDSPGGSALASDLIWHALLRFSHQKPVAISIGNMAASGGYYIASAGERIFADRHSLVGSIGVVGGKLSFGGLMKRWGVHTDSVQRSPRANWMSMSRSLDADERQLLKQDLQRTYKRFLERIATRRAKNLQSILETAEGQVILGADAVQKGLVDELAGLDASVAWVRKKAKLGSETDTVNWPEMPSVFDRLQSALSSSSVQSMWSKPSSQRLQSAELTRLLERRFGVRVDILQKPWHIWAVPTHVPTIR